MEDEIEPQDCIHYAMLPEQFRHKGLYLRKYVYRTNGRKTELKMISLDAVWEFLIAFGSPDLPI